MVQLRKPLHAWYSGRRQDLHLDLTAVMQTAEFLITWCRALEAWHYANHYAFAQPDWMGRAGERKRLKRVLYRVLFIATALRDLADQEMLHGPPSERLDERVAAALDRVQRTQSTYRLSSRLHEYFHLTPDPQNLLTPRFSDARFYDAAAEYLSSDLTDPDRELPDRDREPAVRDPANRYLWGRLTESFARVRDLSANIQDRPDGVTDGSDRPWRDSPFRLLTEYPELVQPLPPEDGADPTLADLGPIFAGAGGLPDNTQMVRFDTFTADQFSPLYRRMDRLGRAVAADWARDMLRGRMPDLRRPWLDSRTKLAGNQLANFAGFLDRRWRSNDWMWGRADSAANTVGLLVRLVDERHLEDRGKPEVVAAARRLAARVGWSNQDTWSMADVRRLGDAVAAQLQEGVVKELLPTAFGDDERPRVTLRRRRPVRRLADLAMLTTGQETPAVLPASRRSGLIFHVGLLSFRAMLPSATGPRTFLIRAAAQVGARPFVVLALLLAMPARAVLLLGLVLAGTAVSGFGGPGSGGVRAGVLGGIAAVGSLVFALRAAATRRRLDKAEQAMRAVEADKDQPSGPPIDSGQRAISGEVQDATAAAHRLAASALAVVTRVYRLRRALAVLLPIMIAGAAGAAALRWDRVGPWLAQGNAASAGGLVAAELLVMLVLWRAGGRPLRARTGTRKPRQPWFIWLLAVGAVAAAIAVGHLDSVVRLINTPVGPAGLTDGGAAWLAVAGGATLLCAMVLVSTFDWMRLSWLLPAWLTSLTVYGGLVILFDGIGVANRPITDVAFASVAYGLSFSYVITVVGASRYPRKQWDRFPEP
jgi:hypothetical protein